ncbi:hypothetical protein MRX96_009870 [Rhipicephalus microplus]
MKSMVPTATVGKNSNYFYTTHEAIGAYLSGFSATRCIHVNFRQNTVTGNIHPLADPAPMLEVSQISEVHVRGKILVENICVRTVYSVDATLDLDDIVANLDAAVQVISCILRGRCPMITFQGTTVPPDFPFFLTTFCFDAPFSKDLRMKFRSRATQQWYFLCFQRAGNATPTKDRAAVEGRARITSGKPEFDCYTVKLSF